MFSAGPNILTAFSASSKTFVLAQKPILLNAKHLFVWHKMFVTTTIFNFFLISQSFHLDQLSDKWNYLQCPILKLFFVTYFSIVEVPKSPGK